MPLTMTIRFRDDASGKAGVAQVSIPDEAARLTRTSFLAKYCAPTVATAWQAMIDGPLVTPPEPFHVERAHG